MKFYLAFFQSKIKHQIPEYSFWEYYLKNGIEEYGHKFLEDKSIDWAYGFAIKDKERNNYWKNDTWQKVIEFLRKNPVDIFLSYLYPEQIDLTAVNYISKELGIPTVNFFCDNLREFKTVPSQFYSFTLNWVPEIAALKIYEDAKLPYIHLPMPMWVPTEYRKPVISELSFSSFIGSKDFFRHAFFSNLKNKNFENYCRIKLFGSGWGNGGNVEFENILSNKFSNQINFIKKHGFNSFLNKIAYKYFESSESILSEGKLNQEDFFNFSRASQVTIGLSSVVNYNFSPFNPLKYSRLRDIEVPMLGGCYLVESNPDLNNLYDINNDVLTFEGIDDFNVKFNELLKYPELRFKLRLNGQRRAIEELNISVSLSKIIERLR